MPVPLLIPANPRHRKTPRKKPGARRIGNLQEYRPRFRRSGTNFPSDADASAIPTRISVLEKRTIFAVLSAPSAAKTFAVPLVPVSSSPKLGKK